MADRPIPSAVAVFAWLATIWTGRPVLTTPFLFLAGFIVLFVIGGVSGVVTAAVPFDWQVTDTYFVVAHIHYVLIGINLFPVVAGDLLLVPQDHGPDDERDARQVELLDHVPGDEPGLLPDAHRRAARDAAPDLHLPRPAWDGPR